MSASHSAGESPVLRLPPEEDGVAAGERSSPVWSCNEWDPLEEVIVGRLDAATIPSHHVSVTYDIPRPWSAFYRVFAGRPYPRSLVRAAERELAELVRVLEGEGVTVRRPEVVDFSRRYGAPSWSSRGFAVSCPRDSVLVVGDELIEAPMAWRSRYFEHHAYRALFKEYFRAGARWTAAPRPALTDDLFVHDHVPPLDGEPLRYVVNEFEPVFDAADFVRCGRDLFVTRSNVTNEAGIAWLERHLGPSFRIHRVDTLNRAPMHIDSSFMPLAPGKLLVNPAHIRRDRIPSVLAGWDVLEAPPPDPIPSWLFSHLVDMCSDGINMNVLMLDERRVIIDATQLTTIKALRGWGFEPIPVAMWHFAPFGGSFHCATLDVRRRGEMRSYV